MKLEDKSVRALQVIAKLNDVSISGKNKDGIVAALETVENLKLPEETNEEPKKSKHGMIPYKRLRFFEGGYGKYDKNGANKVERERVMLSPVQARELNSQFLNSGVLYEEV